MSKQKVERRSVMSDSTIYTVGTALRLAQQSDASVDILVEGQWISGRVLSIDGHGVVLASHSREHAVVKIEAISAVKVLRGMAPSEVSIEAIG